MTSQFIYVVTTSCGDDERAFTLHKVDYNKSANTSGR